VGITRLRQMISRALILCLSHDFAYMPSDLPVDLIRKMRHLRPSFELREKYQYNNQVSHLVLFIFQP
jgi:hypothetical protein